MSIAERPNPTDAIMQPPIASKMPITINTTASMSQRRGVNEDNIVDGW